MPEESMRDDGKDNLSMDDLFANALVEAWEESRRNPDSSSKPPESWRKLEQAYLRSNL